MHSALPQVFTLLGFFSFPLMPEHILMETRSRCLKLISYCQGCWAMASFQLQVTMERHWVCMGVPGPRVPRTPSLSRVTQSIPTKNRKTKTDDTLDRGHNIRVLPQSPPAASSVEELQCRCRNCSIVVRITAGRRITYPCTNRSQLLPSIFYCLLVFKTGK